VVTARDLVTRGSFFDDEPTVNPALGDGLAVGLFRKNARGQESTERGYHLERAARWARSPVRTPALQFVAPLGALL
jgi:hypothetical protein